MATPNINLPTLPSGQTNISISYNEAMQIIDALIQLTVVDKDLSEPPSTSSSDIGKRWIVGSSATDDWSGQDSNIALCVGENLWKFIEPRSGFKAYVEDEEKDYRFISGTWSLIEYGDTL